MATPALLQKNNSGAPAKTKGPAKKHPLWVHGLLFVLTFLSTNMIGMRYMYNFTQGRPALANDLDLFPYVWVMHNLRLFWTGMPFSVTLLGILLTHEFGHYFACRHFKVKATLPYLLPAPTLSGTCGAIIRLKSRIRSRAALILIGASGPLAGFAVALVTTTIGLALSIPANGDPAASIIQFKCPLLVILLHSALVHFHYGPVGSFIPHPIFIASWIGLLITSLNLIPAGQLDGGHMLYAVSPRVHRWCSRGVILALFILGALYWIGWILWACLLLTPGMRHPTVPDDHKVEPWHLGLIPISIIILFLTATISPFGGISIPELLLKLRH